MGMIKSPMKSLPVLQGGLYSSGVISANCYRLPSPSYLESQRQGVTVNTSDICDTLPAAQFSLLESWYKMNPLELIADLQEWKYILLEGNNTMTALLSQCRNKPLQDQPHPLHHKIWVYIKPSSFF